MNRVALLTALLIPRLAAATVDELVSQALQQNGDLLGARQQIAAAHGSLTQASLRANPSLSISGTKEFGGTDNNYALTGSLPLELFGRRDRRIEVATTALKMSQLEAAERERLLRSAIESKFGDALALERNLKFTQELLELNRKSLTLMQARVDKGAAAPLDANLLRVEVNRIDSMRADLQGKLAIATLELKSLAAITPASPLQLDGTLEAPPPPTTGSGATRPDLLTLQASEQAAAARLKQSQTEAHPDATLSAAYQRTDFGFNLDGLTPAGDLHRVQGIFHEATIGLALQLPLRNRNQGNIESATAQLAEARHRKEYALVIIGAELASAKIAYDHARQSLDIYIRGVRNQAADNLAVIRKVYELGRSQLLDVIAEQRRFIEIETGYTDALNRVYQASVRLRTATNRETP